MQHTEKMTIKNSMNEHNLRCMQIIPFFTLEGTGFEGHPVLELVQNGELDDALGITDDIYEEYNRFNNHDELEAFFHYNPKDGFLGQFSKPVGSKFSDDGSCYSFSWGYCHLVWLYADSLEELFEKACQWSLQKKAKDIKKDRNR